MYRDVYTFDEAVQILDTVMDSKTRRHIFGGVLLSISFLFGGLALTIMTINDKEEETNEP